MSSAVSYEIPGQMMERPLSCTFSRQHSKQDSQASQQRLRRRTLVWRKLACSRNEQYQPTELLYFLGCNFFFLLFSSLFCGTNWFCFSWVVSSLMDCCFLVTYHYQQQQYHYYYYYCNYYYYNHHHYFSLTQGSMQQVMECTLICFSFLSEIHIEITLVTILAWVLI